MGTGRPHAWHESKLNCVARKDTGLDPLQSDLRVFRTVDQCLIVVGGGHGARQICRSQPDLNLGVFATRHGPSVHDGGDGQW